jgi:hypothetical protein
MSVVDEAIGLLADRGLPVTLTVTSDSMTPTLPPASSIRVAPGGDPLRRGEILVFRQAGYLVVHRFLGRSSRSRTSLRARGDSARPLDPPIAAEHVVGRVVAVRRGEEWRSLAGSGARAYGAALAWHGLFWSWLRSRTGTAGLGSLVEGADRALVGAADRVFFRLAHRRIEAPPG